jgi:hypothetical protein
MIETGTITGREIATNKDSERPTRLLQVVVSGPDDVQTVELESFGGDDYQPPDGARVFIADVSSTFRIVVAVDDGVEPDPTIEKGEREIYSSDGGQRKAKFRLLKDGNIKLNDGTGTAVEFARLKAVVDSLVMQVNALVTSFNTHTQEVIGVVAGVPLAPAVPVVLDMSPAESSSVVIP